MFDFSDCTTRAQIDEVVKQEAETLAQKHRDASPYDNPQFALEEPQDEERAKREEEEFDQLVREAVNRAETVLEDHELRGMRPLHEHYGRTAGGYYAEGW